MKLLFLGELNVDDKDFSEDGETFSDNAFLKAKYYFNKTGLLTVGEDSGILVDALKGELGVKTRRWGLGEKASDEEWVEHFLQRMDGVLDRRAEFVCHAWLYSNDIREHFFGETKGVITETLMAPVKPGIPLSSCFMPEGREKVYAALTVEEKNEISHRGKAIGQLKKFLEAIL